MSKTTPVSVILDTVSFYILIGLVFVLPFFFLPAVPVALAVSKGLLLSIGITIAFLCWVIARLVDGTLTIPQYPLLLAVIGFPLIYFVAALFSQVPHVSLIGGGFELGTVAMITILSLALFLFSYFFHDKKKLSLLYTSFFISFFIIALFQLLDLFVHIIDRAPGVFTELGSRSLVGSWNDLGVYFGLTAILSLISLESLPTKGLLKGLLFAALIISVFFLMVVNYYAVWLVVGIFALITFVYTLSNRSVQQHTRTLPLVSFLMVLITLVFILANPLLGGVVPRTFDVVRTEVRPSMETTVQIARETIDDQPLFGVGPNRFSEAWMLHKPVDINTTVFWNTPFSAGFGLLPSFLVTLGIVGGLAWLTFLVFFAIRGGEQVLTAIKSKISAYLLVSSFVGALYLWIFSIIHMPSTVLFSLAFILTGVFIGVLVESGIVAHRNFSFLKDPRSSFFSILLLVVLMIGSIGAGYLFTKKFITRVQFSSGITLLSQAASEDDLNRAEQLLVKGANTSNESALYRALSNVALARISVLANNRELSTDDIRAQLQTLVNQAEEMALRAVRRDRTQYQNWMTLGQVYQELLPLQVENAYANAVTAYQEAQKRNPHNPFTDLALAQVSLLQNATEEARSYILQALTKKPNYIDAFFLLAQLEMQAGNTEDAHAVLQQAAAVAPNNAAVFFQLGLLRYESGNFTDAVSALRRAVTLNPDFLNARYFLGLSYYELNEQDRAEKEFTYIRDRIPENETINRVLENIAAGRDPRAGNTEPTTEELPLEDEAVAE